MFDMDFSNDNQDLSMNADPSRPPQHNPKNIASGYGQVYGADENDADSDMHGEHVQLLLRRIVHEQAILQSDISDDDMSSSDGDEGLEDHQRSSHVDAADLGHFHKGEVKRLIAHHHHCDCSICPYRISARVNEWLMNAAIDPETPPSMYPEQSSSGEMSMASSMLLDTTPPTPAHLLAEMASWAVPVESATMQHHEDYEYITSPLWLVPERMVPRQLDRCIPEEIEPASDDEC